jgi:replicative superfamily II helicase
MPIPTEKAKKILQKHQIGHIENLFAQSSARHVLYEVGESEDNFPSFDSALTDKVTLSAYSILAAGVSLAETSLTGEAIAAMEEAATLLINVHAPYAETELTSSFHVLIASMAFHASGQYSRAYVSIRKAELLTPLAKIVASFIRKRPGDVISESNQYLLQDLSNFTDSWSLCDHAVTLSISRSMSLVLEYFATGNPQYLESSKENFNIAMELASDYESPSHWWIARLLRLMISGNGEASLWRTLPPYFPGDSKLIERYVRLLTYSRKSVTELWRSQLDAIPIALGQGRTGAVVNMRTSSGKTRVAELAILQTLHENPDAKILYLAPFRSLALEIEQTLGQIFDRCGFHVSHLYGGFRLSSADRQMAQDSSITIATPEKTRAILRSSPELLSDVRLIIIDEGHLIGADKRYVKNELFVDHLRVLAKSTACRILLLSAVLPNPDELAVWLTGDVGNVVKSGWKPSSERFGILRWQGGSVRIDWKGDFVSYNRQFIVANQCGRQYDHKLMKWKNRRMPFPQSKNEAIAASAVRLCSVGPVMIFSARANSIPGLAACVLTAIGEYAGDHNWPEKEWNAFVATCQEELQNGAVELAAARKGVILHSNKLPSQVRMATERLMRSTSPKIIIASSTLAQGVNIGISSVIVATPYKTDQPIDHRDFWNICGRAGRAFVDGEGKILYAIDETRESWQIRQDRELAASYFNRSLSKPVESGLLFALGVIHQAAESAGIDFEHLMTMVAENDFSDLGEHNIDNCLEIMDLIDDGLLALHEDPEINPNSEGPELWADTVFRSSLAAIQAQSSTFSIDADGLIRFLATRAKQIVEMTPEPNQRKAYVASGLPISAASNVYRDREQFLQNAKLLFDADKNLQSTLTFLEWLEEWARENAKGVVANLPEKHVLDMIRRAWISGSPMREILELTDEADDACKEAYGFQFPWLIHAAAQQLKQIGNEELSEILASIALLVELGVPSEKAAWIFLAGVRSRASATELASCSVDLGNSPSEVRRKLRVPDTIAALRYEVSERSQAWLDLHWSDSAREPVNIPSFPRFTLEKILDADTILVRSYNQSTYLCSPDVRQMMAVKVSKKWPFDRIADDYRFAFIRAADGRFDLISRDPRVDLSQAE